MGWGINIYVRVHTSPTVTSHLVILDPRKSNQPFLFITIIYIVFKVTSLKLFNEGYIS